MKPDSNPDKKRMFVDNDKVQVMVEVKKLKSMVLSTPDDVKKLKIQDLEIDSNYTPVPMTPTAEESAKMDVSNEDIVCICGKISKDKIKELESQPEVLNVWFDTKFEPFEDSNSFLEIKMSKPTNANTPIQPYDCQSGVPRGTIDDVANYLEISSVNSAGNKGQGIVVGVLDGGITAVGRPTNTVDTSNPNWPNKLVPNVIGGPDADWGTTGVSWGWHGNMCATDVLGMAPEAKIYDIRLTGNALSKALAGFQWAINRHRQDGTPQILTNSWGYFQKNWDPSYTTDPNHPFTRKVIEAIDEGIIVLFAAGNCGGYPCADGRCGNDTQSGNSIWGANGHERVMTVSAANKNEVYVGYSSAGPAALSPNKPDFTSITHFTGYFNNDSGTSAATPIAAGVVALMKKANPNLTQNQAKQALMSTAKNIGPAGWDIYTGAGIIQGKKAIDKISNTNTCQKYKNIASKLYKKYKTTKNRAYLCKYYQYRAVYYRCMYTTTKNKKYLCKYYQYRAVYYRCMYTTTKNKKYLCKYYQYRAVYYRCMCAISKKSKYKSSYSKYYTAYKKCTGK